MADFDLLATHGAAERRGDFRVRELQCRVLARRLRAGEAGLRELRAGFSIRELRCRRVGLTFDGAEVRVRLIERRLRAVELLFADDLFGDEFLEAREIGGGLRLRGARRLDLRINHLTLALRAADHRFGLAVDALAAGRGERGSEFGVRLREADGKLRVVELDDHLARLHGLVLDDGNRFHEAADFREDGNDRAVDLRVVGRRV